MAPARRPVGHATSRGVQHTTVFHVVLCERRFRQIRVVKTWCSARPRGEAWDKAGSMCQSVRSLARSASIVARSVCVELCSSFCSCSQSAPRCKMLHSRALHCNTRLASIPRRIHRISTPLRRKAAQSSVSTRAGGGPRGKTSGCCQRFALLRPGCTNHPMLGRRAGQQRVARIHPMLGRRAGQQRVARMRR